MDKEDMNVTKVSDKFEVITRNGETRELYMTLGLMQKLSGQVFSIEQLMNINLDNETVNRLINLAMVERDEKGRIIEVEKDYAEDLSVEQGEKLIEWVVKHITNFFISNFQKAQKTRESLKPITDLLQELTEVMEKEQTSEPSQDGLNDSTSKS